jgi:hypothetical protein
MIFESYTSYLAPLKSKDIHRMNAIRSRKRRGKRERE